MRASCTTLRWEQSCIGGGQGEGLEKQELVAPVQVQAALPGAMLHIGSSCNAEKCDRRDFQWVMRLGGT